MGRGNDVRMHDDVRAAGDDVGMHDDVWAVGDDVTQRRGMMSGCTMTFGRQGMTRHNDGE